MIEIVLSNGWNWKCFKNSECESFQGSIIIMSWIWMALVSVWKLLVFKHFFFEVTCMYCKKLRFSLLPPPSSQQNNLKVICKVLLFYLRSKKNTAKLDEKALHLWQSLCRYGLLYGCEVYLYFHVKSQDMNAKYLNSKYVLEKKRHLNLKVEFIHMTLKKYLLSERNRE